MSILYEGNYRIIDLSRWHQWFPWVAIQLTEGGFNRRGNWRWLFTVERKVNYALTYEDDDNPDYEFVWRYRDVGIRYGEEAIQFRPGGDGIRV